MRRFIALTALFCLTQAGICQEKGLYTLKWGINADYSFSGSASAIVAGLSFFMEKTRDIESEYWHAFNLNAGITWSKHTYSSPLTSIGYYFGSLPGVLFGISSQQYYNVETISNNTGTDVRLSGEIIFALFGFVGYRYQQPLISPNEAREITRHSLIIRIPIPVKAISKK